MGVYATDASSRNPCWLADGVDLAIAIAIRNERDLVTLQR
jgi:hypothetical protein